MTEHEYISARQAAEQVGCNPSWIKQCCRDERIEGAYKMGNSWAIPASFTIGPPSPWPNGYLTVEEAAEELNVTNKRVIQLCWGGRIKGAKKVGHRWAIPTPIERTMGRPGRRPGESSDGEPPDD